jgi:WD40 repeat protein
VIAMLGATICLLTSTWEDSQPRSDENGRPSAPIMLGDHPSPVWTLVFSPDDSRLASATVLGDIRIEDLVTGHRKIIRLGPMNSARSLAFSPDDRTLAIGGFGRDVRLLDASSGDEVDRLDTGRAYEATHLVFSRDGKYLAVGGFGGALTLWDWGRRRWLADLDGHLGGIDALAFSTDGTSLATSENAGLVKVWAIPSGKERTTFRTCDSGDTVAALAFSSDGARLATLSRQSRVIRLWDTSGGEPRGTLPFEVSDVKALAFSPDGATLAMARGDGVIAFWGVAEARVVGAVRASEKGLGSVAFSGDGRVVAAGGTEGALHLVDFAHSLAHGMKTDFMVAGPNRPGDDVTGSLD